MLQRIKNNEDGVVFVTVLIIIITTMVLAISALSLNVSQIKSTENELKYIQAKVLADGGLARIIGDQFTAAPGTTDNYIFTDPNTGTTITCDTTIDTSGVGPTGPAQTTTVPLDIDCTF